MTDAPITLAGSYSIHDTTLCVGVEPTKQGRFGGWEPDWVGHARLLRVLKGIGFAIGEDREGTAWRYRSLRKYHRLARQGDLLCAIEVYATGGKFKFFQDIVTENPNGGRYDFDQLHKMPYLVRKSFERAIAALRQDLAARGLADETKVTSPVPDPLRWFNQTWDGGYERRRGVHRFRRDKTGWPTADELGPYNRTDADGAELTPGAMRYARDRKGYLMRGRVYGGINGMWTFIYGPGLRDHTTLHCRELFTCCPASVSRKQFADPGKGRRKAAERIRRAMAVAVNAENFEVAAQLRDQARKVEAQARAA